MIELKNTGFLKSSIEAISSFIPEGNLRFNERGLHFRAIDPSQIVLVDYLVEKSVFDSFDIEPAFVGVNLTELNKIVSRAIQNDVIKISLSDSEMEVDFVGELRRRFRLPLIDVSDEELKLPETRYDAKVEINSRLFKEVLKDASLFSSSMVLRVQGKNFFMESQGSAGNVSANSTNGKKVKVTSSEDVVSKYSLAYLQNIVKEADPEENITLELKSDSPMKISYNIGNPRIRFFLAHMLL